MNKPQSLYSQICIQFYTKELQSETCLFWMVISNYYDSYIMNHF